MDFLKKKKNILHLPDPALEKILLYLSYHEIANKRRVCKRFDAVCGHLLNKGFKAAQRLNDKLSLSIQKQLPKRDSARRQSPMYVHSEILWEIGSHISMLLICYTRYLECGTCCFIPGMVIDELFKALHYMKRCKTIPVYDLTEVRDLTTMATEHFREQIIPGYKDGDSDISSENSFSCSNYMAERRLRIEKKKQEKEETVKKLQSLKSRVNLQTVRLSAQAKRLKSQSVVINKQEKLIAEMRHTLAESDHKYGELVREVDSVHREYVHLATTLGIPLYPNKSFEETLSIQMCRNGRTRNSGLKNAGEMLRVPKKTVCTVASKPQKSEQKSIMPNLRKTRSGKAQVNPNKSTISNKKETTKIKAEKVWITQNRAMKLQEKRKKKTEKICTFC